MGCSDVVSDYNDSTKRRIPIEYLRTNVNYVAVTYQGDLLDREDVGSG